MRRRTRYEAEQDKREALERAEASGEIADSLEVRKDLIRRFESKEITWPQVLKELSQIKRSARKKGLATRSQVWRES